MLSFYIGIDFKNTNLNLLKNEKTLFTMFIVSLVSILDSCNTNQEIDAISKDPDVISFLQSNTFERIKPSIQSYGKIDFSKISSEKISNGEIESVIIRIPVAKNGEQIGMAVAVNLKSSEFLPYGDTYAVNFENYSKFKTKSLTGIVEMVDLNLTTMFTQELK